MKFIITVLASLIILIGFVSMFTPMPGGTLLIVAGCTLLICSSERAANKVRSLRETIPIFNKGLTWVEDKMGARISGPMRATRPIVPPVQDKDL